MEFSYEAKNSQGKITRGVVDAIDEKSALLALKGDGLFVVRITEKASKNPLRLFHGSVPLKDKIIFTKQLAIMIRSGLSIVDSLHSLEGESTNKNFQAVTADLAREIEGGRPFSEALLKHPDVFSEIYVNMVKSGEKSGKVDEVLERLTVHLEKDFDVVRKIRGALAYPAFVLVTMVVVIAIIIVYVIPQLRTIFDDSGVELPISTKILIGTSDFLRHYGIYLVVGLVLMTVALIQWHKHKSGRRFFDKLIVVTPVINSLIRKTYMARFTRTFAALVSSGLPFLEVFKTSGKVLGNIIYEEEIAAMAKKVEDGMQLSEVFKKSSLFPAMIGQLSAVGEKSGNIDEVFESMADFYDREVDAVTSNLSALLEPILMVGIGVGVAAIVMAVLQPIYGLVNAI